MAHHYPWGRARHDVRCADPAPFPSGDWQLLFLKPRELGRISFLSRGWRGKWTEMPVENFLLYPLPCSSDGAPTMVQGPLHLTCIPSPKRKRRDPTGTGLLVPTPKVKTSPWPALPYVALKACSHMRLISQVAGGSEPLISKCPWRSWSRSPWMQRKELRCRRQGVRRFSASLSMGPQPPHLCNGTVVPTRETQ